MAGGGPAGPYVTVPLGQMATTACAPQPTMFGGTVGGGAFRASGVDAFGQSFANAACAAAPPYMGQSFMVEFGAEPTAPRLHADDVERIARRVVELLGGGA